MWKIKIEYQDKSRVTLTGKHKDIPLWLAKEYFHDYVNGLRCKAIYQQYPKKDYLEMDLSEKIEELSQTEAEDGKRKYVIVCNEHSGMWAGALLFWGHRTQDRELRSFGGYTSDIDGCELYSDREIKEKGYHFPRYHEGMTWEEFRGYDDIVIEPERLADLGYKRMRVWYMP